MRKSRIWWLSCFLAAACAPPAGVDENRAAVVQYPGTEGGPDYTQSPTGIAYRGGDVMTSFSAIHYIFYGTWTFADQSIFIDFATGLSGSPMWNVLSSYTDASGRRVPSTFAPPETTFDSGSQGNVLGFSELEAIVHRAVYDTHQLPEDKNAVYVVLTSQEIAVSQNKGFCNGYCGFHNNGETTLDGSGYLKYAWVGDARQCHNGSYSGTSVTRCDLVKNAVSPNGNWAFDAMITVLFHEVAESVTDPDTSNGYRNNSGATETGDLCDEWMHDAAHPAVGYAQPDETYTTPNGGTANVRFGSDGSLFLSSARDFLVQSFWQNADRGGCVRRLVGERPAAQMPGAHDAVTGDLDLNHVSDLLWRDSSNGDLFASLLSAGATQPLTFTRITGLSPRYRVYGIGDFDADGKADLLIRDSLAGTLWVFVMNGAAISSQRLLAASVPPEQQVKAIGDFNNDGRDDILFQSANDNSIRVWLNSSGTFNVASLPLTSLQPGQTDDYETVGTGDFDGDHNADVLWRQVANGQLIVWLMHGTQASWHVITPGMSRVLGIVDINHDHVADLVGISGDKTSVIWAPMSGGFPAAPVTIVGVPFPEWRFSGGGYLGSIAGGPTASSALFWRNRHTGDLTRWLLSSAGTILSTNHIGAGVLQNLELVAY